MEISQPSRSTAPSSLRTKQADRDAAPKCIKTRHPVHRYLARLQKLVRIFKPRGPSSDSRANSLSGHSDHILKDIGLRRDEVDPIQASAHFTSARGFRTLRAENIYF